MKNIILRAHIAAAGENSAWAKFWILIIFLLCSHILFRELALKTAKIMIACISFKKSTKEFIFEKMSTYISMVTINKTRNSWLVAMNVYIHKKPIVSFFIELSKLTLLIFISKIANQKFGSTNRRSTSYSLYVFSIDDWP